jgi:hypothetical protein
MHYSRTPKSSADTQSLTVRGSLPAWLTGTISRQTEEIATLHTFAVRGGRVTYATAPMPAAPPMHPLADPARLHFRPLISPFSHKPADHARTAQARAAADLAAYSGQGLAVEPDAALLECLRAPQLSAPPQTPGSLYARARFTTGDVAVFRARVRGVDTLGCVAANPPPYIHSVCSTQRYVVLIMTPLVYDTPSGHRARLFDHARWSPELGAQFVVFERETG